MFSNHCIPNLQNFFLYKTDTWKLLNSSSPALPPFILGNYYPNFCFDCSRYLESCSTTSCFWLTSLRIMPLWFVCVAAYVRFLVLSLVSSHNRLYVEFPFCWPIILWRMWLWIWACIHLHRILFSGAGIWARGSLARLGSLWPVAGSLGSIPNTSSWFSIPRSADDSSTWVQELWTDFCGPAFSVAQVWLLQASGTRNNRGFSLTHSVSVPIREMKFWRKSFELFWIYIFRCEIARLWIWAFNFFFF